MPEYVRVREGAWEYSSQRHQIKDPNRVELLDKEPLGPNGKPAPPKPVTPLGTPAEGSRQAKQPHRQEVSHKDDRSRELRRERRPDVGRT